MPLSPKSDPFSSPNRSMNRASKATLSKFLGALEEAKINVEAKSASSPHASQTEIRVPQNSSHEDRPSQHKPQPPQQMHDANLHVNSSPSNLHGNCKHSITPANKSPKIHPLSPKAVQEATQGTAVPMSYVCYGYKSQYNPPPNIPEKKNSSFQTITSPTA